MSFQVCQLLNQLLSFVLHRPMQSASEGFLNRLAQQLIWSFSIHCHCIADIDDSIAKRE